MAAKNDTPQYRTADYAIGGVAVLIDIDPDTTDIAATADPARPNAWRGTWFYRVHTGGEGDRVLTTGSIYLPDSHTPPEVAALLDRLVEDTYYKGLYNCDDCGNPWDPCHCP